MPSSKLRPHNDPRFSLRSAILNNRAYGYLHSSPTSTPHRGTVILIHGFPDLSFGWRYQIPHLTSLGLEVIAIDCMGYSRSEAPTSAELSAYTCKRFSDDVAELCRQLGLSQVIAIGHDWGGHLVYRLALYYPKLIKAFGSVCTPYQPPDPTYMPLPLIVEQALPNFRYQVQLGSGEVEKQIQSPEEIRQFLHAMYGARTPDRKLGFTAEEGVLFDNVKNIQKNKLLDEDEMDYYVREYSRNGMNGPLNWYRTRELNYLDELEHFYGGGKKGPQTKGGAKDVKVEGVEVLFIQATKDLALKPFMARRMDERIEKLTWEKVEAGHWALWEKADEVNGIIEKWLREKVFDKNDPKQLASKL